MMFLQGHMRGGASSDLGRSTVGATSESVRLQTKRLRGT